MHWDSGPRNIKHHHALKTSMVAYDSGRDFSGDPGIRDPRKLLKLIRLPWVAQGDREDGLDHPPPCTKETLVTFT